MKLPIQGIAVCLAYFTTKKPNVTVPAGENHRFSRLMGAVDTHHRANKDRQDPGHRPINRLD